MQDMCTKYYVITPFHAPEGEGRINRNSTTKAVIKCLLPVARWLGVISWQCSRKRAFPVHHPYTGPFTSVLAFLNGGVFFPLSPRLLPIVSVFDRALDRVGE